MAASRDVETKLSAASTRLILDQPFLGALVLRLPMVAAEGEWCRSTATDARRFYYNPDYIAGLSLEQTQFVLAHEALHCALSHFQRRQHRVRHRWDLACDLAVNPILIGEGLKPTPDALYLDEYAGMTAEEIYPLLDDMEDQQTQDEHVYDQDESSQGGEGGGSGDGRERSGTGGGGESGDRGGGGGQGGQGEGREGNRPPPLAREEREQLAVQWRQRMAGAAQQAMQAGKLGGALARMVDHLLQPRLPWRMLLARYLTTTARDDYNYSRPSRREGSAILPSLRSASIDLVVVVDTSGSIVPAEMDEFLSEIDAIKAQVNARITLHACDARLAAHGPWTFETWDELRLPEQISGGGGTDFRPVFEWLRSEGRRPDMLVYFTDAEGPFPEQEPEYPVLWLVKGRAPVPWGTRVQLNG